jgi:EAL domain-containing protein (putative c-di-GMP-specific phosphodiesterase class I)
MNCVARMFEKQEYYHEFQPICSLPEKDRMGYEALFRCQKGTRPEELFHEATQNNRLADLDMQSLRYAIDTFFRLSTNQSNGLLFVNVFPSTIMETSFLPFLDEITYSFLPYLNRIVLEINESIMKGELRKDPIFMERLAELRQRGFLIALDDVGESADTFRKIDEIAPDFIKIDRYYSEKLSVSEEKQQMVRLFVEFCRKDCHLILEGVEYKEDFECASLLGVENGQGFLFGKPASLKGI